MKHAIMVARHAGIADDTPAMDRAILSGIARDLEHHRALSALTSASARPTPENYQMHQAAAELQREAETHLYDHQPTPIAPQPRRKSVPMSVPVSRDIPIPNGERRPGQIILNRDDHDHQLAAISISATGITSLLRTIHWAAAREVPGMCRRLRDELQAFVDQAVALADERGKP